MNTRFRVFASYKILQNLCNFIYVLIFVTVSICQKKSQINEYSDTCPMWAQGYDQGELSPDSSQHIHLSCACVRKGGGHSRISGN